MGLASFVGSYPWYFVFNALQESVPMAPAGMIWLKLLRNAACGFGATCVSDCVSNVIRVLKTTVQTAPETISYTQAAKQVIEKEGVIGLVTRGLGTRLMTNGIQASMFSVLWKVLEELPEEGPLRRGAPPVWCTDPRVPGHGELCVSAGRIEGVAGRVRRVKTY